MAAQKMKVLLSILLLMTAIVCRAAGAPSDAAFADANRAYEQGKFSEAALLYQAVVSNAPTAAAWFNLGNAQFKAGRLGLAIAAWRKAEQITPRDSALRANLAFARTRLSDNSPEPNRLFTAIRYLRSDEWALVGSLAFAVAFLLLAGSEWRRIAKPRIAVATLFVAGAVAAGLAATIYRDSFVRRQAVVTAKQASIRFGPLEDSQSGFQLSDGTEVEVTDETADWFQIEDATGRSGWTRRDAIVLVSP